MIFSSKIKVLSVLFFCLICCISNDTTVIKTISVNTQLNDKCYFFIEKNLDTLKFKRKIKIIKNTFTDTIVVGLGVLSPGQLGKFNYTKLGNRKDVLLDLKYTNPPASRICISPYKGKKSKGILELELIPTYQ